MMTADIFSKTLASIYLTPGCFVCLIVYRTKNVKHDQTQYTAKNMIIHVVIKMLTVKAKILFVQDITAGQETTRMV
jgi:hypothetical protein